MPTTLLLAHPDLKTQRQLWYGIYHNSKIWSMIFVRLHMFIQALELSNMTTKLHCDSLYVYFEVLEHLKRYCGKIQINYFNLVQSS